MSAEVYTIDRIKFAFQPYLRARALLMRMQQQDERCCGARPMLVAPSQRGQLVARAGPRWMCTTPRSSRDAVCPVCCCQPRGRQRNRGALVQQARASSMRNTASSSYRNSSLSRQRLERVRALVAAGREPRLGAQR